MEKNEKENLDIKGETAGDFSPAIVFGNYTVQLTPELLQEWTKKRRRFWRKLEQVDAIWPGPLLQGVRAFELCAVKAAESLGGSEKYLNATFLFELAPFELAPFYDPGLPRPTGLPRLKLAGHSPVLFQRMRKLLIHYVSTIFSLSNAGNKQGGAQFAQQLNSEFDRVQNEWHVKLDPNALDRAIHAVDFEADIEARRLTFTAKRDYPTDLAAYPHRIETTSEALHLVASLLRSEAPLVGLNNLHRCTNNPALQKLIFYYLDHGSIDFNSFSYASDDAESWDFDYPKLDLELERNAPPRREP